MLPGCEITRRCHNHGASSVVCSHMEGNER
jgi:hypothetical protein